MKNSGPAPGKPSPGRSKRVKKRCGHYCEAARCAAEDEINAIIRTSMDGFWVMDPDGRFLDVNDAYCGMIGYGRAELLSMRVMDIEASESPEETAFHMEKVKRAGFDRFETRHRHRDGGLIDVEVSTTAINSRPPRFIVFIRDITLRKKSESLQAQLVQELQIMNTELSEFAHIVSHDLKAPLRSINSLAVWLVEDYADKLDGPGRDKIELLMKMVRGMHNLIEGILQYSKLGGERDEITPVDLGELVPRIISLLAPPAHIRIVIEDTLPTIVCQRTRVAQIFQNLLSNAIEAIDKPEGEIRIGCSSDGEYFRFSVSDNGRGIEKRYFDKIFQVFQVISENKEDGSSGIGLALVKKNVELYGGRVWVESEPGR
ncbi:MAG: PAS domain S-box protein, partial [Nitrospirae bacterium]|nr:PAS domain S-box protein [Nitrospirota bacterium]